MKNIKIGIGFVHNNNALRNPIVLNNLKLLESKLTEVCDVEFVEASYQPQIQKYTMFLALKRSFLNWNLSRYWSKYLEINKDFLVSFIYFFMSISSTLLKKNIRLKENSFVEMAVTNKHIMLWMNLIKDNDFIIIFEDDAVFKENSIDRLNALITQLIENNGKTYLYVDLAGGFDLDKLGVEHLAVNRESDKVFFKKMVTNTACSYALNKSTTEFFIMNILSNPNYRYFSVDWMINALFLEMEANKVESITCIHTIPSIFNHGSVMGDFSPWER
jgi:hypothetical protein